MLKIIDDLRYLNSIKEHTRTVLNLLKEKQEFFSIVVNKEGIKFNPELPEEISSNFSPFTVLALHNYTFESLEIFDDYIKFEAGFGSENYASTLTIPIFAILQIIIDDMIIVSNPAASLNKNFIEQEKISKNIFKLNPNNEHLFK